MIGENSHLVIALIAMGFAILVRFGIAFGNWSSRERRGELAAAYQGALASLRADPASEPLRDALRAIGAEYSRLCDDENLVSELSPSRVESDIALTTGTSTTASDGMSVSERLRRLDALQCDGLLTDEEYRKTRADILATL